MSGPRRMLVISAGYAPVLNARAFRWTALAEHFAGAGWEVDVVTMRHAGAAASPPAAGGLEVHRVGSAKVETVRGQARAREGSRTLALARGLWRSLYWPDGDCLWYWPARAEAVRLARERAPEAIISVSPTFTAVLAGGAALRTYPRARWIIDLGDPFSLETDIPSNNRTLYAGLSRRVERRAFARAHGISVTTPQTAARYAAVFPESAGKIQVIPPLLSIPAPGVQAPFFPRGAARRWVYVGTLYRRLREPQFMLQLFEAERARDPGCELHIFGDVNAFASSLADWRARLGGAVHVHGLVPREAVARAVAAADLLVNIGNTTRDQLPSKVVEYAASGKPILNLARSADDGSATFLASYPDALTLLDTGMPPARGQLEELAGFTASLPRLLAPQRVDAWLAPYRLSSVAARYESLLA